MILMNELGQWLLILFVIWSILSINKTIHYVLIYLRDKKDER